MKTRVLIVDDDELNVKFMSAKLQTYQFDTVLAYGGAEGIAKCLATKPDLIILDVMMPDLDGYTVTRRLKQDLQMLCRDTSPGEHRVLVLHAANDPVGMNMPGVVQRHTEGCGRLQILQDIHVVGYSHMLLLLLMHVVIPGSPGTFTFWQNSLVRV